jgi:hypothetical protein
MLMRSKTCPKPKVSIQGEKRKKTVTENKNFGFLLSLGIYGTWYLFAKFTENLVTRSLLTANSETAHQRRVGEWCWWGRRIRPRRRPCRSRPGSRGPPSRCCPSSPPFISRVFKPKLDFLFLKRTKLNLNNTVPYPYTDLWHSHNKFYWVAISFIAKKKIVDLQRIFATRK